MCEPNDLEAYRDALELSKQQLVIYEQGPCRYVLRHGKVLSVAATGEIAMDVEPVHLDSQRDRSMQAVSQGRQPRLDQRWAYLDEMGHDGDMPHFLKRNVPDTRPEDILTGRKINKNLLD